MIAGLTVPTCFPETHPFPQENVVPENKVDVAAWCRAAAKMQIEKVLAERSLFGQTAARYTLGRYLQCIQICSLQYIQMSSTGQNGLQVPRKS